MKITRKSIMQALDKAESEEDKVSRNFDLFIMTLIVLNVIAVVVETVDSIYEPYKVYFEYFEYFSVAVFTIEYLVRIWACTADVYYASPIWGRIKYIFTLSMLIDLLAILPFYLPLFVALDGRFLRVLRLFRLFRIFKLGRYSSAFQSIVMVLRKRREELVISVTIVIIMLIISSSLMYYVENEAQPEAFTSIPATMWWGVATLTTVGYGDVYPITPLGRLLGAFIAILGVGMFALPAGIIASGFESAMEQKDKEKEGKK
ncbi:MAG: ion transporter [bacterium]|nr:ion transporter [bacterium]